MNENNNNNKDDNISNIEEKMHANVKYAANSHRPNETKRNESENEKKLYLRLGWLKDTPKKRCIKITTIEKKIGYALHTCECYVWSTFEFHSMYRTKDKNYAYIETIELGCSFCCCSVCYVSAGINFHYRLHHSSIKGKAIDISNMLFLR